MPRSFKCMIKLMLKDITFTSNVYICITMINSAF